MQTKWKSEVRPGKEEVGRWQVFYSTRSNRNRAAGDIFNTSQNPTVIMDLEDIEAIRELLEQNADYVRLGNREDVDWQAIVNKQGKQVVDYDLLYDRMLSTLSGISMFLIVSQTVIFGYNYWVVDHGELSAQQKLESSSITFATAYFLAGLNTILYYRLSHVRHHDIKNAERAFEYTDDLLKRLDDIKDEITIKDRVLRKLESFLILSDKSFKLDSEYDKEDTRKETKKDDKDSKEELKAAKSSKHKNVEEGKDATSIEMSAKKSVTFREKIINGFDKDDDLEVWKSVDKTLEKLVYTRITPAVVSYLKLKLFEKYKRNSAGLLEHSNKAKNYTIIDVLTDAKKLPDDADEYPDGKLPVDFIFEQLAKSLENQEPLLAQTILVEIFSQAATDNDINVSNSWLHDIVIKIINKKGEHNKATVEEMCKRINKLKPQQKMALYSIIEDIFAKPEHNIEAAIKTVMKIVFDRQEFMNIIGTAKPFTTHLSSSQTHNALFFSKSAQNFLSKQTAKAQIIGTLPDGRTIQYLGKKIAKGDGNCGFRSILGGKALQSDHEVFTRKGVIGLLKDNLQDKTVRYLIAKDLEAMSREYIAGALSADKFKKLPKAIQDKFIEFKSGPAKIEQKYLQAATKRIQNQSQQGNQARKKKQKKKGTTQQAMATKEIVMNDMERNSMHKDLETFAQQVNNYCLQNNVLTMYLDQYLSDDKNWPHIQGSLAAFGYLCGIKIHCFQKMNADAKHDNAWLRYNETEQPDADYDREAFIIQSDALDHFDQLEFKFISSKQLSRDKAKDKSGKQEDSERNLGLRGDKIKAIKTAIPEDFSIGKSIDNGDCFFDTVAQAWNTNNPDKEPQTVKSLRMICHDFYLNNKELVDELNDAEPDFAYHDYQYYFIQHSQTDLDTQADLRILTTYALWGRPEVEGMMICRKLNIKIHVIGFLDNDQMVEFIIDKEGQHDVKNVQGLYKDPNILHVAQARKHFVPILPPKVVPAATLQLPDKEENISTPTNK